MASGGHGEGVAELREHPAWPRDQVLPREVEDHPAGVHQSLIPYGMPLAIEHTEMSETAVDLDDHSVPPEREVDASDPIFGVAEVELSDRFLDARGPDEVAEERLELARRGDVARQPLREEGPYQ